MAFTLTITKNFALNQKNNLDRFLFSYWHAPLKQWKKWVFVIPEQRKSGYNSTPTVLRLILNYLDQLEKASEEYQGNEIVELSKPNFLNFHYFRPPW